MGKSKKKKSKLLILERIILSPAFLIIIIIALLIISITSMVFDEDGINNFLKSHQFNTIKAQSFYKVVSIIGLILYSLHIVVTIVSKQSYKKYKESIIDAEFNHNMEVLSVLLLKTFNIENKARITVYKPKRNRI